MKDFVVGTEIRFGVTGTTYLLERAVAGELGAVAGVGPCAFIVVVKSQLSLTDFRFAAPTSRVHHVAASSIN